MTAPETIGRYQVVRELGVGGFANVYLARDLRLDAEVAVKLLRPDKAADDDFRDRFIREARVMRRLGNTPGLVTVHDIDEHEGRPFFVMEYCAGGTLADRLAAVGGRIDLADAPALIAALEEATAGIHAAGMVHRDLKPSNYLIRSAPGRRGRPVPGLIAADEELVVADFGLVKAVEADAVQLTVSGGTPGYGAPEQFRGDPTVDSRADVYSLSAIVLAALSGRQPQLLLAPGSVPFDHDAVAAAGPLGAELLRGMSAERERRHQTATDWREALAGASQTPRPANPTSGDGLGAHGAVSGATVAAGSPENSSGRASPTVVSGGSRPLATPGSDGESAAGRSHDDRVGPAEASGRSRRVPAVLATLVVLIVVVAGGAALVLFGGEADAALIGPSNGRVGDEVGFALAEFDPTASWTVNGSDPRTGSAIVFTPPAAGVFRVEVTSDGNVEHRDYRAEEDQVPIRIEGPGLAPIGEATILRLTSADADNIAWEAGGATGQGNSVQLQPEAPGVIVVEAKVDGVLIRREITAADRGG